MLDALDIARYLVQIGYSDETPEESSLLSPLRLQKFLYYCQGYSLALLDRPLFHEPIEAWVLGPVVRSVFSRFQGQKNGITPEAIGGASAELTPIQQELLRMVWREYSQYTPAELVQKTHSEPAWIEARRGLPDTAPCANVLSNDTMKTYFRDALRHAAKASKFPMPDPVEVWMADANCEEANDSGIPLREAIRQAKARRSI